MSVNKIIIFVILLSISIASALLASQDNISIAVLPLQGNGISPAETLVLTDELSSVIVHSGNYIVVERSNMESILEEQGFQLSGCASTECAVEAGKLLGVNKMVTGSVGKLGEIYNINLRMFDVGTGQIEKTVGQKHEGSIEELLDVINKLGYELSGKSALSLQNNKTSANDSENNGKMQPTSYQSKNKIGLWLGINFPRTSTLSEVGTGYRAGLYYKANLSSQFYIQPELSYATSTIEYYEPDDILKFEYLNVTLLLSYEIISTNIDDFILILEAGPALNSILSAKEEYEGYTSDIKSEVNDNSFSIVLGIGLGIRLGKIMTTLGIRYERGLSTIFKDDVSWEVGKSQAFYIIAGISI
jgi:hypothetical protein